MAYVCENCGKGVSVGRSQQHRRGVAGKRWKKRTTETPRLFKPNLQMYQGMKLCTSCLSRLKKTGKLPKTAAN